MMKRLLWVDDCRNPHEANWLRHSPIAPPFEVHWAKSYDESVAYLERHWPDAVCMDHDIGEERTGYDVAKYMVNRCLTEGLLLPAFASQSDNPVGRENILRLFENYKKFAAAYLD